MAPKCPDCGSADTHEDADSRLHCLECGQINDAFVMRQNHSRYEEFLRGGVRGE